MLHRPLLTTPLRHWLQSDYTLNSLIEIEKAKLVLPLLES
jgi:hypothetical protein